MQRIVPAAVVALLVATGLPAQQPTTLRLDETAAVALALDGNPNLAVARSSIVVLQRQAETAWNAFLPSLSAGASLIRANEETTPMPPADRYDLTASATLSASLSLMPQAIPEIEAARLDLVAGRLGVAEQREAVAFQVRSTFYGLLLQREEIAVAETDVAIAAGSLEQAAANHEAGLTSLTELRRAELALATAELNLMSRRAALEDTRDAFRDLLGLNPGTPFVLEGSIAPEDGAYRAAGLSPEDARDVDSPDLTGRADLATVAAERAAQRERIRSARVGRLTPTMQLGASWQPTLPDPLESDNAAHEWSDRGSLSVSLSFALDGLLPFSRAGVAEDAAAATLATLDAQYHASAVDASREYSGLLRRIATSRAAIETQQLNARLAAEILELTEEAYANGTADFTTLDTARGDLAEAQLALLAERHAIRVALIELEYVGGNATAAMGGRR